MKILKLTNLKLQTTAVRLVENENEPTTIEASGDGPLPRFDLVAYTGGLVKTKDIPIPLVVELCGIDIPKQKIPVRFEHKSNQGVGHTEKIGVIGTDLFAAGVISRDTVWARDVKKSAVNGFPWQISMGGPIHEAEHIPAGQTVTVNGQTFEGELYVVRKMTLKEISFVDLGADSNTYAIVEAQFDERDTIEMNEQTTVTQPDQHAAGPQLEFSLHSNNPLPLGAGPVQQDVPQQPAPQTPTPPQPVMQQNAPTAHIQLMEPPEDLIRQHQQNMMIEQRRVMAIEKIGGGKFPELEGIAIGEGWPVEKFRGELQAKAMPDASRLPITGATQTALKPTTLEAIALTTSGISVQFMQAHYEPQTLEAADKYRGIGVQEFCELACGGKYLPKFRRDSRGWLEAAFSSASLPGILSNIANKVLLEGFLTMDEAWRKIVKIASCNNFQEHTRYRMNGMFKFEKVGADGEIKHGAIGEQQFGQRLDTHAIMFALTRQMIIDDDLGAFTDIPRGIGVGAAEAISDALWECLLANAVQKDGKKFFSADHKNLVTGAEAKLGIDGLTKAELTFSEQERDKGRPLGIPANILLVPPALKVLAEMLMKSLTLNETTEKNEPKPVNNPHSGKYELVSSPYLASKAFKGNSATDWYLFANPLRLPALEVAFLGGQDRPTVERADADFNILGIQFRGYIDFGVREQDWRGALKMNP